MNNIYDYQYAATAHRLNHLVKEANKTATTPLKYFLPSVDWVLDNGPDKLNSLVKEMGVTSRYPRLSSQSDWVQSKVPAIVDELSDYLGLDKLQFSKVIAFGDSITDAGESSTTNRILVTRGYWYWALMNATQPFDILRGAGVSGDQTTDLLARMNDVLSTDADIVMLMIGTNDINQGVSNDTIETNFENIVTQITNSGKYVVVAPVAHRSVTGGFNATIDDLNSRYRNVVSANPKAFMADSSSTFNNLVGSEVTELQVTTDGLHPNTYGAKLLGEAVAPTLNNSFISSLDLSTNLAPNPEFSGTSGSLLSGATGTSPDDWRLYYADPTDSGENPTGEVAGNLTNGYWTLKTGSEDVAQTNKAFARTGNHPLDSNSSYIATIDVDLPDPVNVKSMKLVCSPQLSADQSATASFHVPIGSSISSLRLQTPEFILTDSTYVVMSFTVESNDGTTTEATISNPCIYKLP